MLFTNHKFLKFLLLVFIYSFYELNIGDWWPWPAVVSSTTYTCIHKHKHTHTHTQSISRMLILILRLVFWNSKPIFIFWANLSRKSWILHFAWNLVHKVSWGCDCQDTEKGLKAKIKMNNCIKCLLLLYFYRS